MARLRRELEARACTADIVVKIEKPQAVQQLEAIVAATDAVMVARGDMGVEMDVQRVPAIQKRIIAACNRTHRPVITATQMLNSMEQSSRPTRAEASDVFNAVLDGTDAVMLSGESAIGQFPVEAVTMMREICTEAEAYLKSGRPSVAGRGRGAVRAHRRDDGSGRRCRVPDDAAARRRVDRGRRRVRPYGASARQPPAGRHDSGAAGHRARSRGA